MEDIIALGLLYRLIAKNEKVMTHSMASDYISAVNKGLIKLNSDYDIHNNNKRFQVSYALGIDEQSGSYYFSDLNKDIFDIHDIVLDSELLTASLSEEALDALGIKELLLSRDEKIQYGSLELSVMSRDCALEAAMKILEDDGFRAISLGEPIRNSKNNAYDVHYSAKYTALKVEYLEEIGEKVMALYLELKTQQKKRKIAASSDPSEEIQLDKLLVADTFVYEDGMEVLDKKRIVFPLDGDALHADYFVDFFDDSIMSYFPTKNKSAIRVKDVTSLEEVMQARYATVESIQKFLNTLNKEENKGLIKDLKKRDKK